MTERERLTELLNKQSCPSPLLCDKNCRYAHLESCYAERVADHLLENGVIVPPCRVGDTMYKVCTVNSKIKFGDMWDGKVVEKNCDRCGYKNCSCYDIGLRKHECSTMIDVVIPFEIKSRGFLVNIMPYVGKVWFTTEEEAEQFINTKRAVSLVDGHIEE